MKNLLAKMQVFIGHAKFTGATKEEIEILAKAYEIIDKYLPKEDK